MPWRDLRASHPRGCQSCGLTIPATTAATVLVPVPAFAASPDVVINQVCRGGSSGATADEPLSSSCSIGHRTCRCVGLERAVRVGGRHLVAGHGAVWGRLRQERTAWCRRRSAPAGPPRYRRRTPGAASR